MQPRLPRLVSRAESPPPARTPSSHRTAGRRRVAPMSTHAWAVWGRGASCVAPWAHLSAREHFSRAGDDPYLRLHQPLESDRVLVAARVAVGCEGAAQRAGEGGRAAGAAGTGEVQLRAAAGGLRSDFVGRLEPSPQNFEAGRRREDLTLTAVKADRLAGRLPGRSYRIFHFGSGAQTLGCSNSKRWGGSAADPEIPRTLLYSGDYCW